MTERLPYISDYDAILAILREHLVMLDGNLETASLEDAAEAIVERFDLDRLPEV